MCRTNSKKIRFRFISKAMENIDANTGSVAIRFPSLCSMLELSLVNPAFSERPDLIRKNCAAAIKHPIVEDCERPTMN
jgi:hypothetical protein